MTFKIYTGDGTRKTSEISLSLPESRRVQLMRPDTYLADPGLVNACNVALLLRQPLLLTGEPGTGKTLFASSLAWELGLDEPLKFETKSTSTARDLFYTYDALKRFQDIQSGLSDSKTLNYLTYNALGSAILLTKDITEVADILSPDFVHKGKTRAVVLIDEVDKAPRDFPNDILNEIENMYFRIPELGNMKIEADPSLHPIVIITSNSEKDLPDAFLRRCIYYDIPFPDRERLSEIIASRIGVFALSDEFLRDALNIFFQLREGSTGLRKKPATAELLGWIITLRQISPNSTNPLRQPDLVWQTLSNLVKTAVDQEKARGVVNQWLKDRNR